VFEERRLCRSSLARERRLARGSGPLLRVGLQLPHRRFRLHHETRRRLRGQLHVRPRLQAAVPLPLLVVGLGVSEPLRGPGEHLHPFLHGPHQHGGLLQARQVRVSSEVLDQLPHLHVIPPPQRHAVELHA
jgi:hypothetical protein